MKSTKKRIQPGAWSRRGCASMATASTAANMMSIQPSVVAVSKSVSSACGVESKRWTIVGAHLSEPATLAPSAQHSHTSRDVGVAAASAGHAPQHGAPGNALAPHVSSAPKRGASAEAGPNHARVALSSRAHGLGCSRKAR